LCSIPYTYAFAGDKRLELAAQCKKCGKPLTNTRAGSFTSYFFQQNYCQCNNNIAIGPDKAGAQRKSTGKGSAVRRQEQSVSDVCTRCGKSVAKRRAGSFTSFLFQELRCQCAQPSLPKKERLARTNTQVRRQAMAAKRGYTANFRANAEAVRNLPQVNFSADTLIGGAFRIISIIGEGGMGIVYLAQHLSLNRPYALKVLSPSIVSEQSWLRFKAEAKTLAALNHPGLVRVYDLGIHANTVPYYSMDYLDGETLEELLVRKGPQTIENTTSIFLAVLDTLAYAHRNNVVHRDIKPANIFICKSQEIKVLDFGISKLVGEKRNQELTAIGEVFGSPYYMSPEQCRGEQIDFRSDIYSVGCSLFETLTGCVPFESANSLEIAMLHEEGEIPLLSDVCEMSFPPSFDVVIAKCLAKLPQDRYQSAKEMAIDLTRIKEGKNLEAYSSVASNHSSDFADDHAESSGGRSVVYALLAVFGLCLTCGLGLFLFNSKPQQTKLALFESSPVTDIRNGVNLSDESSPAVERLNLELETVGRDVTTSSISNLTKMRPLVESYLKSAPKYYSEVVSINGKRCKRFSFPTAFSLGLVRRVADSGASRDFEATGVLVIPSEYKLEFISGSVPEDYPELFDRFRRDDLVGLALNFNPEKSNLIWSSVSRLKSLQTLNMSGVRLDAHSLKCMELLPVLQSLALSNCSLDTSIANSSVSLPKLRSLKLAGIESVATLLRVLPGRLALKGLTVEATKLSRIDIAAISSVHGLEYLRLIRMRLNNDELSMLASLSNLKALVLADAAVDRDFADSLTKFKSLETLVLPVGVELTKSDEQKIRQALPHIKPFM
jgi:serine/threonine protein kinase/ssDNA-binding Zn-finger/Zn-ribbon topoisomerase 1